MMKRFLSFIALVSLMLLSVISCQKNPDGSKWCQRMPTFKEMCELMENWALSL